MKMKYIKADTNDTETIPQLVQKTIQTIYPAYYPKEIVDFFLNLHSYDSIAKDIEDGFVGILVKDGVIAGTGCCRGNHITCVYVDPKFQKQGFGSFIMQCLEDEIAKTFDTAVLDSSLPAKHLYQKRGYITISHERYAVENDVVLEYEVMEKDLRNRKKGE